MVEVAHHQLEDGAGLDPAVDLLAQTAQQPASAAQPAKVTIQCGARDLAVLDSVLAHQNVDECGGRARADLAAQGHRAREDLRGERPQRTAILPCGRAQGEQAATTVGTEVSPQRPRPALERASPGIGVRGRRHPAQDRAHCVVTRQLDRFGDQPVAEGSDFERSLVPIIGHALVLDQHLS